MHIFVYLQTLVLLTTAVPSAASSSTTLEWSQKHPEASRCFQLQAITQAQLHVVPQLQQQGSNVKQCSYCQYCNTPSCIRNKNIALSHSKKHKACLFDIKKLKPTWNWVEQVIIFVYLNLLKPMNLCQISLRNWRSARDKQWGSANGMDMAWESHQNSNSSSQHTYPGPHSASYLTKCFEC